MTTRLPELVPILPCLLPLAFLLLAVGAAQRYRLFLRVGTTLALMLLALGGATVLRTRAGLAGQPVLLISQQEAEIGYSAAFDPTTQEVNGIVTFDYLSADGVRDYLAFNERVSQALAHSSSGALRLKVIFNHPLSQQEVERFIQAYTLEVHGYTLRAVEANGTRVTIMGAPEDGQLVPAASFGPVLRDVQERGEAELNGWIEADVTMDASMLAKLRTSPVVFTTEAAYALVYGAITPQALRQAHADEATIERIQAGTDRTVQVTGPSLYWGLENLGLVPMPTHSRSSK